MDKTDDQGRCGCAVGRIEQENVKLMYKLLIQIRHSQPMPSIAQFLLQQRNQLRLLSVY